MFCWTPFCSTPWACPFAGLQDILVNFKMCLSTHTQSAVLPGGGCPGSLWLAAAAVPGVSSFFCHLTTFRYVLHPHQRGRLLEPCCLLSWHCAVNVSSLREVLAALVDVEPSEQSVHFPLWEHTCLWAPCLRYLDKCVCINKQQAHTHKTDVFQ